jgi:L-alanine-DL-glutamate epimerase-like enolase superfamily enzyme
MARIRELSFSSERWEFRTPFRISGRTFASADLLLVSISQDGSTGRGEAAGVYYLDETGASMMADVASVRDAIETGADRHQLRGLLPNGGARNALDCALWDLEAKRTNTTVWQLAGIEPRVTRTVLTIGIGTPEEMAAAAASLDADRLKVKLDSDMPMECIAAVRSVRPRDEIIVDVNQGWTFDELTAHAPRLAELGVALIEQPLPRGGDRALEGYRSPVPLCADESCLCIGELEQAARRYQVINIKLDKTGGLTEALELAGLARSRGMDLMVGGMMGTSLAVAPAYLVAQLCRYVDLDAAQFLTRDRDHPMTLEHGVLAPPRRELWG